MRSAVSTEYIEPAEATPVYRVYYPQADGMRLTLRRLVTNYQLACEFYDLDRDIAFIEERLQALLIARATEANYQIQVLSSLFFRNKGATNASTRLRANRNIL